MAKNEVEILNIGSAKPEVSSEVEENISNLENSIFAEYFKPLIDTHEIKALRTHRTNITVTRHVPYGLDIEVYALPLNKIPSFLDYILSKIKKTNAIKLNIAFYKDEEKISLGDNTYQFQGKDLFSTITVQLTGNP